MSYEPYCSGQVDLATPAGTVVVRNYKHKSKVFYYTCPECGTTINYDIKSYNGVIPVPYIGTLRCGSYIHRYVATGGV